MVLYEEGVALNKADLFIRREEENAQSAESEKRRPNGRRRLAPRRRRAASSAVALWATEAPRKPSPVRQNQEFIHLIIIAAGITQIVPATAIYIICTSCDVPGKMP